MLVGRVDQKPAPDVGGPVLINLADKPVAAMSAADGDINILAIDCFQRAGRDADVSLAGNDHCAPNPIHGTIEIADGAGHLMEIRVAVFVLSNHTQVGAVGHAVVGSFSVDPPAILLYQSNHGSRSCIKIRRLCHIDNGEAVVVATIIAIRRPVPIITETGEDSKGVDLAFNILCRSPFAFWYGHEFSPGGDHALAGDAVEPGVGGIRIWCGIGDEPFFLAADAREEGPAEGGIMASALGFGERLALFLLALPVPAILVDAAIVLAERPETPATTPFWTMPDQIPDGALAGGGCAAGGLGFGNEIPLTVADHGVIHGFTFLRVVGCAAP